MNCMHEADELLISMSLNGRAKSHWLSFTALFVWYFIGIFGASSWGRTEAKCSRSPNIPKALFLQETLTFLSKYRLESNLPNFGSFFLHTWRYSLDCTRVHRTIQFAFTSLTDNTARQWKALSATTQQAIWYARMRKSCVVVTVSMLLFCAVTYPARKKTLFSKLCSAGGGWHPFCPSQSVPSSPGTISVFITVPELQSSGQCWPGLAEPQGWPERKEKSNFSLTVRALSWRKSKLGSRPSFLAILCNFL